MPTQIERLAAERTKETEIAEAVVEGAAGEERDLVDAELEIVKRSQARIGELDVQLDQLASFAEVRARSFETASKVMAPTKAAPSVEYRDAGAYVADVILARSGDADATGRLETRVAENQTTADNLGMVPDPIMGPVVDFIDARRPVATSIGVRPAPTYPTFHRAIVTQHTAVAAQSAEKVELASQKMTIARSEVTMVTAGGYVDVSIQDAWATNQPGAPGGGILAMVVESLAKQYAIHTEGLASADLEVGAGIGGAGAVEFPVAVTEWSDISKALFGAAGEIYAATSLLPDTVWVAPDMWAVIGPWLPNVNPQNAISTGAVATSFGTGAVSGLRIVVGPQLTSGLVIIGASEAIELYEHVFGQLQVTNVPQAGYDIGYVGAFGGFVLNPAGFMTIATAVA